MIPERDSTVVGARYDLLSSRIVVNDALVLLPAVATYLLGCE